MIIVQLPIIMYILWYCFIQWQFTRLSILSRMTTMHTWSASKADGRRRRLEFTVHVFKEYDKIHSIKPNQNLNFTTKCWTIKLSTFNLYWQETEVPFELQPQAGWPVPGHSNQNRTSDIWQLTHDENSKIHNRNSFFPKRWQNWMIPINAITINSQFALHHNKNTSLRSSHALTTTRLLPQLTLTGMVYLQSNTLLDKVVNTIITCTQMNKHEASYLFNWGWVNSKANYRYVVRCAVSSNYR